MDRISKSLSFFLIFLSGCAQEISPLPPISWSHKISSATQQDSWGTWDGFYRLKIKPSVSKDTFMKAIDDGQYEEMSIEDFLKLNIENHCLNRYRLAKRIEDIYPKCDNPRGAKDITSLRYHLNTQNLVSPVTIVRVVDKHGNLRRIKMDGVHRLAAAMLRHSPIRVLWIRL